MYISFGYELDYDDTIVGIKNFIVKINDDTFKFIEDISNDIKKIMEKEAPEGTGALKNSIEVSIDRKRDSIISEIEPLAKNMNGEKYALYVETGRDGNGNRPNIAALKKWMSAKGINAKYAGAIAHNIAHGKSKANKPNPFVKRTFDDIKGDLKAGLEKTLQKTAKDIFT